MTTLKVWQLVVALSDAVIGYDLDDCSRSIEGNSNER